MRVQCDVCEKALAEVVCCADEAALCLSCDQRVHAANKLASKHQRLPLLNNRPNSSNPPLPLCDICQEKGALIFCLEDRALLCRNCDLCIHAVNTLAAGHQRFLATGVQVALASEQHLADEGTHLKPEAPRPQPPPSGVRATSTSTSNSSAHTSSVKERTIDDNNMQISAKQVQEWQNTQSLDFTDLVSGYPLIDIEFSKTDLAPLSDQDWMADLCVFNEHVYADTPAEVPQPSFSLHTDSPHGLESSIKGKQKRDVVTGLIPDVDDVSVVPDLKSFASHALHAKRQKSVIGELVGQG